MSSPQSAATLPQICLGMLEHCTNVVSVELDIEGPQNFLDASPMKEIHLRHLKVLKIHITFYSTKDHLIPFLRYLKPPALQSLSLFLDLDFRDDASSLTHPLQRFLTQAPSLRYLCTNCTRAADIRDVLQHTPSLTELEFVSRDINDSFLEGLRYSDTDSDHLVPKLDMLTLRNVGNGFSELSLAEAIRSRWWSDDELLARPVPPSVTRLKEVTFEHRKYNPKDFTQEFQETMRTYRLQGLILDGFETPYRSVRVFLPLFAAFLFETHFGGTLRGS
ncbi:hypothetical protein B0H11DRAFT_1966312 [Mycena galericulata]|nr:hypothetical protein B0H11DRAFT_1966312 [Mycena galericulata]